jgi:hydroxymethylbilane synthase
LAQATWVRKRLEERYPGLQVEIKTIKTSGDRFLTTPLKAIGGKGIFVKEIEEALVQKKIDLAVHSMKDLPTEIPTGLAISAITKREDPRDVLVDRDDRSLKDLPSGARVGTGSLRRQAQILHYRSDLVIVPIRGNVDTRLKKLARGEVDALVMAAAGLKRIGQEDRVSECIPPDICLNAVGQGALGLETRFDGPVNQELAFLHHAPTAVEVSAERAFLKCLGGGCQIPVGAWGCVEGSQIRLMGVVGETDGGRLVRGEITGPLAEAEKLGQELAERLLQKGADKILADVRGDSNDEVRVIIPGSGREGTADEDKPLFGRHIVVTRPRSQANSFVRGIEELGGEVVEFPTIEIVSPKSYSPLDRAINKIESYDWLIFTSVNGVRQFFDRIRHLGRSISDLNGIRIAAIGPETAKSLEPFNLQADLVPGEYRAEAILQALKPGELRGKRVLLPRVAGARDVLPKTLREWGAETDVIEAYRTVLPRSDATWLHALLLERKLDVVTFTSSSTVINFAKFFPGEDVNDLLDGVAVACIGPITQKTAEEKGIRVDIVPREYTVEGLTQAIVDYFKTMR